MAFCCVLYRCYSYLGMINNAASGQKVSIGNGCTSVSIDDVMSYLSEYWWRHVFLCFFFYTCVWTVWALSNRSIESVIIAIFLEYVHKCGRVMQHICIKGVRPLNVYTLLNVNLHLTLDLRLWNINAPRNINSLNVNEYEKCP